MSDFLEFFEQVRQHPKLIIADDFELTVQNVERQSRKFRNGEEALSKRDEKFWVSLRLLHRRGVGRSVTNNVSRESLAWLVESAFVAAEQSGVDPWFRFPIWKNQKVSPATDRKSAELDSLYPELVTPPELLDEKYDNIQLETAIFRKTERSHLSYRQERHALNFSVMTTAANSRRFSLKENRALSRPLSERRDWLGDLLGTAEIYRTAEPFKGTVKGPVVFGPRAVAKILQEISPWFSAESVTYGKSPWEEQRLKKIFSPVVTIVDDGTLAGASATVPFDMEGTSAQRTVIVEGGFVRNLLCDSYYAARGNRLSTGNLVRDLEWDTPRVGPTTQYIEKGSTSPEGLYAEVRDGLLIEWIDELEVPATGMPNDTVRQALCSGRRIVGGALAQPVFHIDCDIDLRQLFEKAVQVGDDLTFFGDFGSPSILFENMPLRP